MPAPQHVHEALDVVWDGAEVESSMGGYGPGTSVSTPPHVDHDAIALLNRIDPARDAEQRLKIELFRGLASSASVHRDRPHPEQTC